jgi:hypothetical protein
MSRQIQIRRGTATEHTTFTGAIGEITMDTTNKTLRVHDGTTAGGTILAKQSEIPDLTNIDYVIETQTPTSTNNYTWYRKYKSGWVEQGGYKDGTVSYASNPIIFPIKMADTNYSLIVQSERTEKYSCIQNKTATGFCVKDRVHADIWYDSNFLGIWKVEGISAQD